VQSASHGHLIALNHFSVSPADSGPVPLPRLVNIVAFLFGCREDLDRGLGIEK